MAGLLGGKKRSSLFDALTRDLTTGLIQAETRGTKARDPYYQKDPVAWAVDILGIPERTLIWSKNPGYEHHRWDGTVDPLATALESLAAWKDAGVESATGTGKTFLGGAIVIPWFLTVFEGSMIITSAPKEDQLKLHMWKELNRVWPKFKVIHPEAEAVTLRVRMKPTREDWTAVGFACGVGAVEQSATKAQGFHAEHMLIITEETPGIHSAIMTAFENTSTGPHNLRLAFGNPDNAQDALHEFCLSPGVVHIRISALDHPNVVCRDPRIMPGAVSQKAIDRRREKYGEESPIYQSRVRGISPSESASSLIKLIWCSAAAQRWLEPTQVQGEPAMGVDVANSSSGDEAAIAHGRGNRCEEVNIFPCPDANMLGLRVSLEMDSLQATPEHVGIDAIGVGAGTVGELRRQGKDVFAIQSASPAQQKYGDEIKFGNLRAQMWWQTREDLRLGRVDIPPDEELYADLTAVQWETRLGKVYIEEKKKLKERIGRSPNKGDAFVYWNWVRQNIPFAAGIGGNMIDF